MDLVTGDRALVSGCVDVFCTPQVGKGPLLQNPVGIAVEPDGFLVVALRSPRAIVRVDPITGNRTLLSGCNSVQCEDPAGIGPEFNAIAGIAIEQDGSLAVTDVALAAVLRVDPRTGNRSFISQVSDTGGGPPLDDFRNIVVDANGSLIVLSGDSATAASRVVIRVDPVTGDRTILGCLKPLSCPGFIDDTPTLQWLTSVGIEENGSLVLVDFPLPLEQATIVRVDPMTGDRDLVSGCQGRDCMPVGAGLDLISPFFASRRSLPRIAIETDGSLVVADTSVLVRIDPRTGDRNLFSGCYGIDCDPIGSGPRFIELQDIAVDADGSIVVVHGLQGVMRVDPVTGDRKTVSGCGLIRHDDFACLGNQIGSGPRMHWALGIAIESNGSLLLADDRRVLRIDPVTGDRTRISGCSSQSLGGECGARVGNGQDFVRLGAIAVEANGSLVFSFS